MKSRFAHQKSTITYLSIILILQSMIFHADDRVVNIVQAVTCRSIFTKLCYILYKCFVGFFQFFSQKNFSLLSSRVWSVAFLGCVAYHVQERRVCGERESYILRTRHIKCWLLYKHCHIAALCNNFSSSRSPWYQWFSLTLLKCFVRFW